MQIKATISKKLETGKTKAIVDVTLDGAYVARGFKVIESEKGTFVSMPSISRIVDGKSVYDDTFFPITAEAREKIIEAIKNEYKNSLVIENPVHNGESVNAADEIAMV